MIRFEGDFAGLEEGAAILLEEAGIQEKDTDMTIMVIKQVLPCLSIDKSRSECSISFYTKASFFRGLSLLLFHADREEYHTSEKVLFASNGCMLDCSRNAVLKVDKIKELLRKMAALGMNRLMLYTEDTYEVEGHPYFGTYRGRYTQEELRVCDDYADMFGIEMIPCIQTLAHLHNVLKWPEFHALQDTKDVILSGSEETYRLLKELIAAASRPFRSNKIHLGMDEACYLGLGKYLEQNGYRTPQEIMKEHLEKVYAICEEAGLEPMIWSDMYITANTGSNYYELPEKTDTSGWMKPPKGLGLVYWDYYHHEEAVYLRNLGIHSEIAKEVVFAGGSWLWNGVAPNLSKAVDISRKALSACEKLGIRHVICTCWQDDGAETPVEAAYPVMTLYAEAGYGRELTEETLGASFTRCFGGVYGDFMLFDDFDYIDKENKDNKDNRLDNTPSKYMLYQDVMLGIFDKQLEGFDIKKYYEKLYAALKKALERNTAYNDLFSYYLSLADVLMQKGDMGIRLKQAYDEKDRETLQRIAESEIPECCKKLDRLKSLREKLWMKDNKPFGYELMDIKLGSVSVRLCSAAGRINGYLEGRIERLEELEEPRLLYRYRAEGEARGLCYESHWLNIISGSDLMDTI